MLQLHPLNGLALLWRGRSLATAPPPGTGSWIPMRVSCNGTHANVWQAGIHAVRDMPVPLRAAAAAAAAAATATAATAAAATLVALATAASACTAVRGCSVRQGVRLYRRCVQEGVQKQGERTGEAGVQGGVQDGP